MLHSKGNSGNSWDQQTYSVRAFKEKRIPLDSDWNQVQDFKEKF